MRIGIIYCATSPSGKKYYGRSIQPLAKRKYGHNYAAKNGSELYFHRAIRKYGDKMEWNVIEKIKHENREQLLDILNKKEITYISNDNTLYPGGYNLSRGGGNYGHTLINRTGKTYEEIYGEENANEIKKKQKENNAYYWKGKKQSKELIKKRIESKKGFKHSEESKEKTRQSLLGVKHTKERRKARSELYKGRDFSKNFGLPKYGEDNPAFIKLSKKQIEKIIYLHTKEYKTAKQIEKEVNVCWAKVLKTLRENNVYLTLKELGLKRFNDNKDKIIKLHIKDKINPKKISRQLNLNPQRIINFLKEEDLYERIDRFYKYEVS